MSMVILYEQTNKSMGWETEEVDLYIQDQLKTVTRSIENSQKYQDYQDYSIDKGNSISQIVLECLVKYIENIHMKLAAYGSIQVSHHWESEAGGLLKVWSQCHQQMNSKSLRGT